MPSDHSGDELQIEAIPYSAHGEHTATIVGVATDRYMKTVALHTSEMWSLGALNWTTTVFLSITVSLLGFIYGATWDLAVTPDVNQETARTIINIATLAAWISGTLTVITFLVRASHIIAISLDAKPKDPNYSEGWFIRLARRYRP